MKFTKRKRQPAFHSLLHFCTPSKNSCDFDFAQFPTTECQFKALSKRSRIFLKKGDFFSVSKKYVSTVAYWNRFGLST